MEGLKIVPYNDWLKEKEYWYFSDLMKATNNNQSKVAALAKISRGTARKKLKLHGFI